MFDKLKNAVIDTAIRSAIDSYAPRINEKLEQITTLDAHEVSNDASYHARVVTPALNAVVASSNGKTKMIPDFERRFASALLHVRKQLIVIDAPTNKVSLVPDYRARISDVLVEGFKQSA